MRAFALLPLSVALIWSCVTLLVVSHAMRRFAFAYTCCFRSLSCGRTQIHSHMRSYLLCLLLPVHCNLNHRCCFGEMHAPHIFIAEKENNFFRRQRETKHERQLLSTILRLPSARRRDILIHSIWISSLAASTIDEWDERIRRFGEMAIFYTSIVWFVVFTFLILTHLNVVLSLMGNGLPIVYRWFSVTSQAMFSLIIFTLFTIIKQLRSARVNGALRRENYNEQVKKLNFASLHKLIWINCLICTNKCSTFPLFFMFNQCFSFAFSYLYRRIVDFSECYFHLFLSMCFFSRRSKSIDRLFDFIYIDRSFVEFFAFFGERDNIDSFIDWLNATHTHQWIDEEMATTTTTYARITQNAWICNKFNFTKWNRAYSLILQREWLFVVVVCPSRSPVLLLCVPLIASVAKPLSCNIHWMSLKHHLFGVA